LNLRKLLNLPSNGSEYQYLLIANPLSSRKIVGYAYISEEEFKKIGLYWYNSKLAYSAPKQIDNYLITAIDMEHENVPGRLKQKYKRDFILEKIIE